MDDLRRAECFWRKSGPIAYNVWIILNPLLRATLPDDLLASGLHWHWDADPRRPLTALTPDTCRLLAEDLQVFADTFSLSVTLFGLTSHEETRTSPDERTLTPWLREFSVRESGPVQIVVVQEGDMPKEVIFVAHHPSTAVQQLLDRWGIDSTTLYWHKNDSERRGVFERLFNLPARY